MKANAHKIIGKTRRGTLVLDAADQNRDSRVLPWALTDQKNLAGLLAHVAREQGRLLGKMEGIGFDLRREAPDSAKVAHGVDESLYQMKATPPQESVKWTN